MPWLAPARSLVVRLYSTICDTHGLEDAAEVFNAWVNARE
jgi:hypothetical protein